MMRTIAIFTSTFPYPPGEQFLESEIQYWSRAGWARVILVPYNASGIPRPIPDNIIVESTNRANFLQRIFFGFRALSSTLFWQELLYLYRIHKLRLRTCGDAFRSVATVFFAKHKISTIIEQYGPLDCAYCYWHSEIAYAACMMKRSGSIDHVAARAHRTDVYEYLGFDGYMPLKRQFGTKFDAIYAISLDCQTYLEQTYHIPSRIIHLSRLGVCVPLIPGSGSIDNVVRIVSVSFCVSIKRIDKIIDAIQAASALNTNLSISWIHIGDGLLRSDLERYASIKLNHPNISFSFIGERDNSEVLDHYASKAVDIFINCSASEGVPVSIMEAMSYGIPAIAPDVGGVSELVNDECGVLLPHNFSDLDISDAIIHLVGEKRQKFRDAARFKVIREYSAEVNYIKFVMSIRALCETGRT